MILCLPGGRVTFCCANIFILFLTTSMPLSLEAFSSWTPSLKEGPSSCLARHRMVVVLPTPGRPVLLDPGNIFYGFLFSFALLGLHLHFSLLKC